MDYMITCPYCFEVFSHEDAMFRSETFFLNDADIEKKLGYSQNDIDYIEDDDERSEKGERLNLAKKFVLKRDPKYAEFWNRFDGITTEKESSRGHSFKPWDLPIIGKDDVELVRDGDGFVEAARDRFGRETETRVCPYCHNPIPAKFGKHRVKRISIIGTIGAGKTVYISQLLKQFEEYVSKVGMSAFSTSNHERDFVEDNKIQKGYPLPASTKRESFSQPMFYDIVYSEKNEKKTETIVIYDIAGENCRSIDDIKRFGNYVKKADGIILLIDPRQVNFIPGDKDTDTSNIDVPSIAIRTLHNFLTDKDGEKCKIPMAVCISKSDECFDILPPIASEEIQINTSNRFDAKSYNKLIMGQDGLVKIFERNAHELCQKLRDEYLNFNFFAISAIGCCCGRNAQGFFTPLNIPNPKRIEEPIFWLFKQFGMIKSNDCIYRPFRIENAPQYRLVKPFFKKPYLEEEKPDYSLHEDESIRTAKRVLVKGTYVEWSEEFDNLEVKKYEAKQ